MLVLLGFNHRSAPLEIRERVAFGENELTRALAGLSASAVIQESMILSTCNRVEILVRATSVAAGLDAIQGFLLEQRNLGPEDLGRYGYHYHGRQAVRHLFRVASGLDSMLLGEPQITGQVKQAYRRAGRAGATGIVLERLLQQALATAKRVRTETGISRNAVSVAFAAVELARQIFGDLRGRSAMLLGAGKMGALVATHLIGKGVGRVEVSSRTYNRAVVLATRFGGRATHWDAALSRLAGVDIVVSGTGAPRTVLDKSDIQQTQRAHRGGPLLLIDIAVPRDIDPAVNELDNVYLYDVDDLQGVVETNLDERRRAVEAANRVVEEGAEAFERWRQSLRVAPTIVSLRETLHGLGVQELDRFRRRLGPLSPEQERAVREMIRAIIQKVLHRPIRHLKGSVDRGDAARSSRLLRDIFGVEERSTPGPRDGGRQEPTAKPPPGRGPSRVIKGGKES